MKEREKQTTCWAGSLMWGKHHGGGLNDQRSQVMRSERYLQTVLDQTKQSRLCHSNRSYPPISDLKALSLFSQKQGLRLIQETFGGSFPSCTDVSTVSTISTLNPQHYLDLMAYLYQAEQRARKSSICPEVSHHSALWLPFHWPEKVTWLCLTSQVQKVKPSHK